MIPNIIERPNVLGGPGGFSQIPKRLCDGDNYRSATQEQEVGLRQSARHSGRCLGRIQVHSNELGTSDEKNSNTKASCQGTAAMLHQMHT